MGHRSKESHDDCDSGEYDDDSGDQSDDALNEMNDAITLHRFPCLAHTLQLVLKEVENNQAYANVLKNAKSIVKQIRCSSVATEKLIQRCGMTVVTDCSTRWNSNLFMIERLLTVKPSLIDTLQEMKIDGLLDSEWMKLDDLHKLLKPFKDHTNTMRTDSFALSNVIPVILDLNAHLQDMAQNTTLTLASALQRSLNTRFDLLTNPENR